ncbi:Myb-like DNA-binding domain containing protein [Trichomonas vaginalis G3]|uniref:Myb-like DNA-binding domain containing protein n=1 Tax=Trichomonas vaginalis (strain ATCC PRA-98 / G3) TaxID=412133 RepID=A2ER36_TRIV3|nr:RNA polymerase II transcription regulator recruiting protein [Trichomonas vaginalis G3]EAY04926.1 Myb-like DNA-binding domain containing protein [Trichomonas vaginalis G3]KAI5519416.1 RNA polymerase II transcription regulator recruiting protein [Trichomonas vaginalis G3]|eukprot:XP_001317149.1 Myb-like DNA-binding domain containing protein [Trichomonas vaginalis G3]
MPYLCNNGSLSPIEQPEIQNVSESEDLFPVKRVNQKRQSFSKDEDQKLTELVEQYGQRNWNFIANKLPGRTARQVRERWINYLSPNVSHEQFTQEEDELLEKLMDQYGTKWSKIAEFFPKRTDVLLKNHGALIKRQIKKGKRVSVLKSNNNSPIEPPKFEMPDRVQSQQLVAKPENMSTSVLFPISENMISIPTPTFDQNILQLLLKPPEEPIFSGFSTVEESIDDDFDAEYCADIDIF